MHWNNGILLYNYIGAQTVEETAVIYHSSNSLLKKGSGSEPTRLKPEEHTWRRGACPLFQRAANSRLAIGSVLGFAIALAVVPGCGRTEPDLYTQARNDLETAKLDQALVGFNEVFNINPLDAKAAYYCGVVYDKQGDFSKALAGYADAIRLDGEIVEARGSGDPGLVEKFKGAVPLESDLAEAHVRRGIIYNKQRNHDEAIDEFTRALKLSPRSAEAYCGRGVAFLEKGLLDVAMADLTEAVGVSENYADARYQRARAHMLLGNSDQALDDGREAIRLNPAMASAYGILGSALLDRGDYSEAVACLDEAVSRDARLAQQVNYTLADALFRWSIVLKNNGKYDEANGALARAKRLDEKYVTLYPNGYSAVSQTAGRVQEGSGVQEAESGDDALRARVDRGLMHLGAGEIEQAIEEFSAAINSGPQHAAAYYGRGLAFVEKGFPDVAIDDFEMAIDLSPHYAEAYSQRCRAYTLVGDYLYAARDGKQAVRLRPKYAEAYYHLGLAYLGRKEYEPGVAALEESVRLDPALELKVRPTLIEALRDIRDKSPSAGFMETGGPGLLFDN